VRLLSERRGDYSEAEQLMAVAMAWTHDLIEDGVKPDGSRVTAGDLRAHPFDVRIIQGVIQLTNPHGVSKTRYYETLKNIDYLAKLVKCVDHICNLREGKDIFEPARWKQYVEETRTYIRPLAQTLRDETRDWLWLEMDRAMAARPVNA
jgi:(p)ppGpp synthase/HD superfamily hydrolase